MTNVSRTNRNGLRPTSDFYPTPAEAVRPFIAMERDAMFRADRGRVWECAAGDGAIAQELRSARFKVIESDLYVHARVKGTPKLNFRADFLNSEGPRSRAIVTNPPFKLADDFVRHALRLGARYVAMLLPITYLAGLKRADVIDQLARVLVLAFRVTLKPKRVKLKNSGVVTYAWFVWERGHRGPATLHRLYRVNPQSSGAPA